MSRLPKRLVTRFRCTSRSSIPAYSSSNCTPAPLQIAREVSQWHRHHQVKRGGHETNLRDLGVVGSGGCQNRIRLAQLDERDAADDARVLEEGDKIAR